GRVAPIPSVSIRVAGSPPDSAAPVGIVPASAVSRRPLLLAPDHKNSNIRPPFLRTTSAPGRREFPQGFKQKKWQSFRKVGQWDDLCFTAGRLLYQVGLLRVDHAEPVEVVGRKAVGPAAGLAPGDPVARGL